MAVAFGCLRIHRKLSFMRLHFSSFTAIRFAAGVSSAIALASVVASPTFAAEWPTAKPIRVVVPYPAGGAGDVTFRTLQPHLEKALGAKFYVDSKSGASGNIGASDVARAPADGYTFLLGATNNYVMNQFLFKMDFDPLKDLAPISKVVNAPLVVLVNASMPAKTLSEFSAYAKQNAGKLNYSSPGIGTGGHLGAVRYAEQTGTPLTHVPYRGAAPALQAVMGGEVQAMFVTADVAARQMGGGRLRALAVMGPERLAALPDVPAVGELGLPGLYAGNWWGLSAPAGTDPVIVDKMAKAVRAVVSLPEVIEQFRNLSATTIGNAPAEFAAELSREAATWKALIERSQIKVE